MAQAVVMSLQRVKQDQGHVLCGCGLNICRAYKKAEAYTPCKQE